MDETVSESVFPAGRNQGETVQPPDDIKERAVRYAHDEQETYPQEAFKEFATSLLPDSTEPVVDIGLIQKAAGIYNQTAPKHRRIELYYHFTDMPGAEDISKSETLGQEEDEKIFITKVTPQAANPLLPAKDALDHIEYWGEGKVPSSFKEQSRKFALQLKAMWRYRIIRHLDKSMVTVGGAKT